MARAGTAAAMPGPRLRALLLAGAIAAASVMAPRPPAVRAEVDATTGLQAHVTAGRLDAQVVAALDRNGQVDAIVSFTPVPATSGDPWVPDVIARWKARALEPLLAAGAVLDDYARLLATFARFRSAEQLLNVLADPAVSGVRVERASAPADAEANRLIRQPQAAAAGYRGSGTAVAVLDSGANYRRAALGSCTSPGKPSSCRVAAARDFAPWDNELDATGHGTAVAEVVLAVAPRTKILALDVFRADGLAYDSDILGAIDWVIGRRAQWNVRALNLSIADGTYWTVACPLSGLAPAFEAAGAARIVVSVASGNAANVAGLHVNGVAYPACVPGAMSVGGVYDADVGRVTSSGCTDATTAADHIACFSQGGPLLDLLAPAALITAGGREGWRGTSFATAHAAGAAAVLAAAERSATAERIGYVLRTTGPTLRDPRNGSRRHRLDVYAAASRIRDTTPPSVTSRSPLAGAVGVPPSANVVASFSEGVTGVGGGSMWLRDAQGIAVPARVAYDAARRRATLDPTLPLLPGARYTVRLTSDIRDAAGNQLRSYIWSFTTAG